MSPKQVFVREATGLVRQAGLYDVFSFNGLSVTGPQMVPPWLLLTPFIGADSMTVILIATFGSVFTVLMYYILSVAMPRSGGDYIFVSRLLHPSLGFVTGILTGLLYGVVITAWAATVWVPTGLSPMLAYFGTTYKSQALIDFATTVNTPMYLGFLGSIMTIAFTLILMFAGMKRFFVVQNILVTVGVIGQLVMLAVVLTTTHESFVQAFNNFAQSYGTGYSQIFTQAKQLGWTLPVATLYGALLAAPNVYGSIFWAECSSFIGGEIKTVKRTQAVGMLGAALFWALVSFGIYLGALSMAGYGWVSAYDYIVLTNPVKLGLPPVPSLLLYANVAANNPIIVIIMSVGLIVGTFAATGWSLILFSRTMFAASFDRVLPAALADVNDRFGTPMKSLAIGGLLSLAFMFMSFVPQTATYMTQFGVAVGLQYVLAFIIVGVGAILFPYLRKDLYDRVMPFKQKIVGVPLITWIGAIVVLFNVQDVYFILSYPTWYGITVQFAWILAGSMVIGVLGYYVAKLYRAKRGIDLSLVFMQIPPE